MGNREEKRNLETIPVGSLGIIALEGCKPLGEKVDQYLVKWRAERESEHKDSLADTDKHHQREEDTRLAHGAALVKHIRASAHSEKVSCEGFEERGIVAAIGCYDQENDYEQTHDSRIIARKRTDRLRVYAARIFNPTETHVFQMKHPRAVNFMTLLQLREIDNRNLCRSRVGGNGINERGIGRMREKCC